MAAPVLRTLIRRIAQMAGGPRKPQVPDRQLLEDFSARHDEAAFTELVARHGPLVLRVCRRVLQHEQDAEDAFQASFLVLAQCSKSIRQRETLANWLHGVAYRTAMNAKRSASRRRHHETRLQERATPTAASPTWDDVQGILDEEILRLPASFRSTFVLCVLEGKTIAAAAAELKCKEGTVASRLARARQRLQQQLSRRGIELSALLAALCVVDGTVQAAVPRALAQTAVRAAVLIASGGTTAGLISAHVAALATAVTRAMFIQKAKIATLLLLTLGLFVSGAGVLTHQVVVAKEQSDGNLSVYPDPYIGNNNDRIPDASAPDSPWRRPWWFRRAFEIPAEYTGRAVWLHLDGINYRAAVWVNGKQAANERDLAGMFRRFRFDISALVHPGMDNALAIRIFPVDYPGVPGYRQPGTDPGFQRNVTEMGALGWDWVPPARDRNMGIWQHVWIESSGPVAVWDPAAFTDVQLPGGKQAAITLRFHVENTQPQAAEAEVSARIEPHGFHGAAIEVRRRIEVPARTQQEVVLKPSEFPALNMRNPRLWWPHGYGDQPLYQFTVEARINGVVSHRQVTQFGVRKLGYYYRPAEYAHTLVPIPDGQWPYDYPPLKAARVFTVNGRPIRMAGGSMVPDFLLAWNAQRYRDEVRLMTEGNHTVIRICGVGIIMPDVFYDEADRRGLLVWQDLARSSFGVAWRMKQSEIPAVNKDLYLANMRDTIMRLRGRTSLLAWCGTNEAPMQADIGMALQNELLPALDGSRPWLPSTSTEPPWAKEPLGMRSFGLYVIQDLHYYFDHYAHASDFLFKDEIGLESLPRYNSIAKAIPEVDAPTTNNSWVTQVLLDHGFPAQHMTPIITERIGAPATLADFTSMSELLSAQAHRAIFEAANKNRPRNSGTMVWMTNAAWLDCMYQLYDWYLHPTASYYAVKSAVQPLHVQYALDDHILQIVSTLAERRPLQVHAVVMSPEGRTEEVRDYKLTAEADATTLVGPGPATLDDANFHFLSLDLRDPDGREVDRLVTWTQSDEKWGALLNLAPVPVSARVIERTRVEGESQFRITVRDQGSVPAVHVWVEVIKGTQGDEVLPCFWSDNALTMLPGEERELRVRFRDAQLGGATPRVMVEGFNVLPNEFGVLPDASPTPLSLQVDDLAYESHDGGPELKILFSQTGAPGQRWTTWPLPIVIDGQSVRSLHVALSGSGETTVHIPLHAAPGIHRVQAGAKSLEVRVE